MQSTNLGQALSALIDKNYGSQRAFAKACGVDQATIHHALNGRPCSRENLALFCQKISAVPQEQFAVLIAHLMDEAIASGLDATKLLVRAGEVLTLGELKLDTELQRDLALLATQAIADPEMRALIAINANFVRRLREGGCIDIPDSKRSRGRKNPQRMHRRILHDGIRP